MLSIAQPPGKILVIPLRFIGDTVLTVPLLRNLRHHFPKAQLDVWTSPTTNSLLEPCPYLSQVVMEPSSAMARLQRLQEERYDAVFILRKSFTMALLCKLSGVKNLVGYDKQRFFKPLSYRRWGLLLDHQARYPSLKTETPQALSHLSLLTAGGLPMVDSYLELWATPNDEAQVNTVLAAYGVVSGHPLAGFHGVSASHGKTLPLEKYGLAIQSLRDKGFTIVCTGTQADAAWYDALASDLSIPLINLAGKTTLRETFALYQKLSLLLTVDSGPIHLAAAAGVPKIVGVFGPTNEKQWGPYNPKSDFYPVFLDLPCRPCYAKVCSHNQCREELSRYMIADGVKAALNSGTVSFS